MTLVIPIPVPSWLKSLAMHGLTSSLRAMRLTCVSAYALCLTMPKT
ncbi:hypothetical protein ACVWXD_002655 [Pseudomonas sp. TE3911]